jgi:hypothetical protein
MGSSIACQRNRGRLNVAKVQVEEGDEPAAVVTFPDSHGVAGEHGGEIEAGQARHSELAGSQDNDGVVV